MHAKKSTQAWRSSGLRSLSMIPRIRVRIPLDLEIMFSFAWCHEAYSEPGVILTQDNSRKGRGQQKTEIDYIIFFPFSNHFFSQRIQINSRLSLFSSRVKWNLEIPGFKWNMYKLSSEDSLHRNTWKSGKVAAFRVYVSPLDQTITNITFSVPFHYSIIKDTNHGNRMK